nr:hypothetical protein [Escherichia coli]
MQLLREYMPLEKMAALYVTGVDTRWPEEALSPEKLSAGAARLRHGTCQDTGHVDRRTAQTARLS